MSDVNELLIKPLQEFARDSMHLVKKCTKPDRKGEPRFNALEAPCPRRQPTTTFFWFPPLAARFLRHTEFMIVARATTVGFLVMGFIGFFVKLFHIPISK
ncbi:unnamed protein product [Phaeothamnion confervicola]